MMVMAKIVSSDLAPSGKVQYSLGGESFELSGKSDSYETSNPELLRNVLTHPWLSVQYDRVEVVAPVFRNVSVEPKDDPLSAQSEAARLVNDPKAIEAAEKAKLEPPVQPVAIEAGLDQTEKVVEGGVARTLAADKAPKKAAKTEKEND